MCTIARDFAYDYVLEVADDDDATVYNEATNFGVGDYYSLWDARATAVCDCDTSYFSADCSKSKIVTFATTPFVLTHPLMISLFLNSTDALFNVSHFRNVPKG